MADVSISIGADLSGVGAEFKKAEQQIAAAAAQIQQILTARLAAASAITSVQFDKLADASGDLAKEAKPIAPVMRDAGKEIAKTGKASDGAADLFSDLGETIKETAEESLDFKQQIEDAIPKEQVLGVLERLSKLIFQVNLAFAAATQIALPFAAEPIINASSAAEQLKTQLTSLFNSAAVGNQAFAWIDNVQGKLPGFEQAFVILKNSGIDPTTGALEAVNAAAARAGGGVDKVTSIARQFGQAWAGAALRLEEINILIDNGLPIFQLLQDVTGKSVAEIRKLATAGALGRDVITQLFDRIQETSGSAIELNVGTFEGQIATLQRDFTRFLRSIGDAGFFDFVKQQLQGLIDRFRELQESGRLDEIANRIKRALVVIGESFGNLVNVLLDGLIQLGESGSLETFANVTSIAIDRLTDTVRFLIENFKTLATTATLAFGSFSIIKIALVAVAFAELARVIFLVGSAAKTAGVLAFLKSVVVEAAAATVALVRFAFGIGVVRAELISFAISAAIYTAIFAAIAAAVYIAFRAFNDFLEQQRKLQEELRKDTNEIKQFIAIREELRKIGAQQADEDVARLFQQRQLGLISEREALERANNILKAETDKNNKIKDLEAQKFAAESALQTLRERREQQANEKILAFRRSLVQEQIKANQQRINDAQKALQQIENEEEKAAKRILDIQREITEGRRQLNDEIFDTQQSGRDESTQAFFAQLEVQKQITEAQRRNAEAAKATTEEERKAALEAAKAATDRAQELSKDVGSNTTRIALLRQLQGVREETLSAEQKAIEAEQKQRELNKKALQETIQLQQQNLAALEGQLDRLRKDASEIKLNLETEKAQDELAKIQIQLEKIKRDAAIDVQIRRSGGGAVPGFAGGGRVFGPGGIDKVPAWLTRNEYVLTTTGSNILQALQYYSRQSPRVLNLVRDYALRNLLPSKLPKYNIPIAKSPAGRSHFATGGDVPGGRVGDTVTLNLKINNRSAGPVTGSREAIDMIVGALTTAARATA